MEFLAHRFWNGGKSFMPFRFQIWLHLFSGLRDKFCGPSQPLRLWRLSQTLWNSFMECLFFLAGALMMVSLFLVSGFWLMWHGFQPQVDLCAGWWYFSFKVRCLPWWPIKIAEQVLHCVFLWYCRAWLNPRYIVYCNWITKEHYNYDRKKIFK